MKIEIVRYLLDEIDVEQDRIRRYEAEKRRARKEADKTGKHVWQCEKWNEPYPRKVRIAENCKLARRILLDITKESEGNQ